MSDTAKVMFSDAHIQAMREMVDRIPPQGPGPTQAEYDALQQAFNRICERLQATVERHQLGRYGEPLVDVLCDALDAALEKPA